ncbi:hypothetical protein BS78_01G012200 [Paspalum vaginatum]|nr:hypothetical protein BS78_01G012200 [Paspalum vaginatum]
MSRCFPFPPPGYEKTARPDAQLASHLQQLDKEKHKEKKHKKDKKEKEKKEGKEKKDKNRSKDKHKDKKDRKEKHKDKKKDKSKDKSRESGEGIERHDESLHDPKVGESSRRSEENKDIKSREDFVRKAQTQDEKGAASRPVESYAISNDRSRGVFSASHAMETGRSAVNKTHIPSSNVSRKNEGLGQQSININQQKNGTSIRLSENITASAQRSAGSFTPAVEERFKAARPPSNTEATPRKEGIGQRNISILVQKRPENPIKDATKKEVNTAAPLLQSPANSMHKGNGKVGRPLENTTAPMQRVDSPSTSSAAAGMDRGVPRSTIPSPSITMDRGVPKSTIPSPSITIRRPNGMVRPIENLPGVSPSMGKEKEQSGRLLQANITTDQKLAMSKPPAVDKAADGRAERIEKVKDGAPDASKKEDKKSDRHEKKKRKEKDKHKEKKKEKEAKKEKGEHNHKEHDKLRESNLNCPTNNLYFKPSPPPVAPPVDDWKPAVPDENLKKRKNHETNGYLQNNNDMRPTKLPRPALPEHRVENGTASHVAAPLSSVKPEAIKIEKAERLHKEEKVNGKQQAQPSSVDPVAAYENGTPSRKSPHPDCKYLSQIYSIPEAPQMTEWPEHEGEGWLFDQGSSQSRKPNSEPVGDAAPQVWAQALKIDPADVVALPYVIPF